MTRRVLRWEVPVDDGWHEIGAGRVVEVAARAFRAMPGDLVEVWTLEDIPPGGPIDLVHRSVMIVGTGHLVPENTEYLGTAIVPTFELVRSMLSGGKERMESRPGLVWHVFGAFGVMP